MTASSIPEAAATDPHQCGRLAVLWAIVGACASIAVIPYATALHSEATARIPVSQAFFVIAQFIQAFLLLGLLSWLGLRMGTTVGLHSPIAYAMAYGAPAFSWPAKTIIRAAFAGVLTGAAILALDRAFAPAMPDAAPAGLVAMALWKRLLACFYGGIAEELMCRLFLMSFLVWLCHKIASGEAGPARSWMICRQPLPSGH